MSGQRKSRTHHLMISDETNRLGSAILIKAFEMVVPIGRRKVEASTAVVAPPVARRLEA